ncbi:MAG: polyketide synthase [Lachnospiraceae bacterium]|nr:polyketide synthase [Lachnospiraceae bacterium]
MSNDIAIIGIAGRFPMANSVNEFWDNLISKKECIARESSLKEGFIKAKGMIPEIGQSVGEFFGLSAEEKKYADPQLLALLQTSYEALEDSGYHFDDDNNLTGVFISAGSSFNWRKQVFDSGDLNNIKQQKLTYFMEEHYYSTQLSYRLNLKGPSLCIMASCASSLVCIHQASQALLLNECDIALAGSAYIDNTDEKGYYYDPDYIYSKDGICRSFCADSSGTVPGNGVGIVILKLLENAIDSGDLIYGVIKGSAVNNDGSEKLSFTSPTVEGISEVVNTAIEIAEIEAEEMNFIETHGTGTPLGDMVEFEALKESFSEGFGGMENYCLLGALKPNIGYLEAASGIASFIKASLSVYRKLYPANINITKINDKLELEASPFLIEKEHTVFHVQPVTGAVVAYADGGTNACVLLQSAVQKKAVNFNEKCYFLTFSAKNTESLEKYLDKMCAHLSAEEIDLDNAEYTLNFRRSQYPYACGVICLDKADLIRKLSLREVFYRQKAKFGENEIIRLTSVNYKTVDEQLEFFREIRDEWLKGKKIDWSAYYAKEGYSNISLPTYVF